MFPATPAALVRVLEERLGSRPSVRHLLALASAAVLVAFPYDQRADFLKGVDERLPRIRRLGRDSEGNGPSPDENLRAETLVFVLHGLEARHHGDRERILAELEAASALALSERPSEFSAYRRELRVAHETILRERLAARIDLN